MRLKGTLTEEQLKEDLMALQPLFTSHSRLEPMKKLIRKCVPDAVSARALRFYPDDEDDVFVLLVDDTHLVEIMIPPETEGEPEICSVKTTGRGLKRHDQIKLAAALKQVPETTL